MKTRETLHAAERDYSMVIIVIGITVMMNILFSTMGLDVTDTASDMACNLLAAI